MEDLLANLPQNPTLTELRAFISESDLEFATIAFADYQGTIRGKYVSRAKLESALEAMSFPAISLVLDPTDAILAVPVLADSSSGYPDRPVRLVPETARFIPWAEPRRNLLILAEFAEDFADYCPRNMFHRMQRHAERLGFRPCASSELEFTMFDETPQSIIAKGYHNLQPSTPNRTYYSLVRQETQSSLYNQLMDMCAALRIPVDSLHEEMGEGFMELAIRYGTDASVPDATALFRTFAKVVAQRNGKLATFMARWSNNADGQSGHIHASLQTLAGEPVFHDPSRPDGMSETMRHFIGGMQALLGDFLLLLAPNINSYKRLVPGIFAPISTAWGIENRTCAIRAIPGSPGSSRIECRLPGADANPYLSLAGVITAGLHGVEHRIEPSAPCEGNAYEMEILESQRLPASFDAAITRFRGSEMARHYFGDAFVEAYADSRRTQYEQFQAMVTDRELERFFELV
ncbi:glutamine synthetase [Sphingobium amiense]|uniref:Glutamine synthetase n=1 Tax=Sphingobium amiense TaxID=135719 RepID=A0A494W808_9SPHN|nr:hypothetical protein [Sphingobium amiense]BBD96770.1 glutamine synthetase [Sphingobium amiense]